MGAKIETGAAAEDLEEEARGAGMGGGPKLMGKELWAEEEGLMAKLNIRGACTSGEIEAGAGAGG